MNQVIAELVQLARQSGDTGSSDQHRQMVTLFLSYLQVYVTEEYIVSVETKDLRALYHNWVFNGLDKGELPPPAYLGARVHLVSYLGRRQKEKAEGENVVSLF